MISMSGFGSGKASGHDRCYHVECSSVNRKGLEIVMNLPRGLASLESQIREEVQKKIKRGRIHIVVTEEAIPELKKKESLFDHDVAKHALKELQQLQKSLHLTEAITLKTLLKVPGVLRSDMTEQVNVALAWKVLQIALKEALQSLLKMRMKEGKNLVADLKKRVSCLELLVKKIQTRVPLLFEHRRKQLISRFTALNITVSPEDPSLLRELAFFAERSDINEEVVRLQSHLLQCHELLTKIGEARTCDYLAQEMFREFNTLANKANDAEISRWVVQSKSELDKIREQLANLE